MQTVLVNSAVQLSMLVLFGRFYMRTYCSRSSFKAPTKQLLSTAKRLNPLSTVSGTPSRTHGR